MNNRGQIVSIISFIGVIIGLLIIAPILLKVVTTTVGGFTTAINATNPVAGQATSTIQTKFVNMFDYVILACYFLNVIILMASAFMIDIHPFFIVLYIVGLITLFTFGTVFTDVINTIWSEPAFSSMITYLPISSFMLENFWLINLVIVIITGVVMFAKIKMGGGGNNAY